MSTDSITLWKNRIENRRSSGLKVDDWCKQNSISRHAYYYWHRKVKDQAEEQENVFAEIPIKKSIITPTTTEISNPEMTIRWKDFSITVTDSNAIDMAAELLCKLEKEC